MRRWVLRKAKQGLMAGSRLFPYSPSVSLLMVQMQMSESQDGLCSWATQDPCLLPCFLASLLDGMLACHGHPFYLLGLGLASCRMLLDHDVFSSLIAPPAATISEAEYMQNMDSRSKLESLLAGSGVETGSHRDPSAFDVTFEDSDSAELKGPSPKDEHDLTGGDMASTREGTEGGHSGNQ